MNAERKRAYRGDPTEPIWETWRKNWGWRGMQQMLLSFYSIYLTFLYYGIDIN